MANNPTPVEIIDEKVVTKIAHLARLELEPQEIPRMASQLSNIFDLVAQLNQVNTENISPMYSAHAVNLRMRDDVVTETNQRDQLLRNAPKQESGLFLVPHIFGQGEGEQSK